MRIRGRIAPDSNSTHILLGEGLGASSFEDEVQREGIDEAGFTVSDSVGEQTHPTLVAEAPPPGLTEGVLFKQVRKVYDKGSSTASRPEFFPSVLKL